MRDVYAHPEFTRVGYYKSVLEDAGIACLVKNDATFNITEASSIIITPTLAVVNDEDYDRAKALLRSTAQPPPNFRPDWVCPTCGEEVPGNFDACWNCGAEAPEPNPAPTPDA